MTSTRLQAGGGAHVDDVVVHQQIAAFDQFDAHLLRQKGVLEIGGVEDAGREQHDRGLVAAGGVRRAERAQRRQQRLRVVIDRADAVVAEESGEDLFQNLAVRQHVGDAARHAEIIFEHGEAAIGEADEVGAADADVDSSRYGQAAHFATEMAATVDEFARDDAIGEDAAAMVDIFEEEVERGDALGEAAFDFAPFVVRDDARQEIVGEDALGAFFVAVDGEGDALMEK